MSPGRPGTGHDHGGLRAYRTKKWRCDSCGKWMDLQSTVVIIDEIRGKMTNHRIINQEHTYCMRGRMIETIWPGIQLIGADGLAMLLGWLSSGLHTPNHVIDLIWRFHVPRFEVIHPWFLERYEGRPVSDLNAFMCMQEDLDAMAWKLNDQGWPPPIEPSRHMLEGATPAKARMRKNGSN